MRPILVTAPTARALSTADARASLKLGTDTSHDDLINQLILSGTRYVEQKTNRGLCTQTWRDFFDGFPGQGEDPELWLSKGEVVSVESVHYIADTGTLTLGSSVYGLMKGQPAFVYLKYGQTWPNTINQHGSVWVDYVVGQEKVDPELSFCVQLYVNFFFENRQATEVPKGLYNYIRNWKIEV